MNTLEPHIASTQLSNDICLSQNPWNCQKMQFSDQQERKKRVKELTDTLNS
jgi:hypothetical protein